jgi:6,7-dimethyl-8-ribityllumazine synthase
MVSPKQNKKASPGKFSGKSLNVCIIVSQWHKDITDALLEGAFKVFEKIEIDEFSMEVIDVPGSFELPLGAKLAINRYSPDAVICLGCIIKGETPHFDYISKAVSEGITTDTLKQAKQRSGGKHGNKGADAAMAALEMTELSNKLKKAHAGES